MAIPAQFQFEGPQKEFQFRDSFVLPLLRRLGFGVVVNYHGQREFGRDAIFGDIDRFGHVVYYGMQIKYESSISLGQSHTLIEDAEQATHNPFRHPQTGREEFISSFYVANAGHFSDHARTNFFNAVVRRGVRDARLLDGNALLLLDKAAALNRRSQLQEQLTGILQEIRRNSTVVASLTILLTAYANGADTEPFPMIRCRNNATGAYLASPFPIPNLPIDTLDQYWEHVRMLNAIADSIGVPITTAAFRSGRASGFAAIAPALIALGATVEATVTGAVNRLGEVETAAG